MCKNMAMEGYFVEFLRSVKSNSLRVELFNIIVSYKMEGNPPSNVSEKARPFCCLIKALIEKGKGKKEVSEKRKAAAEKRWAKEKNTAQNI